MTLALLAFATRNYIAAPRAQAVARRAAASGGWLEWRFLPNVLRAIDANALNLATKARFVGLSVLSLLVGVLTTGAYLGYAIMTD